MKLIHDIYENFDMITKENKVVLWGIKQRTLELFCEMINRRIPVLAFVDIEGVFKNETKNSLLGVSILGKDEFWNIFHTEKHIFILADKTITESSDIQQFEKLCKEHYYLCTASNIDINIRNRNGKKLYIYGAGSSGKRTYKLLASQGIKVSAFIDSDRKKWGSYIIGEMNNIEICSPELLGEDDLVIISTLYFHSIKQRLLKQGVKDKYIFVDIRNSREFSDEPITYKKRINIWFEYEEPPEIRGINWLSFLTVMMNDICGKRKVILYGLNGFTSQCIEVLEQLGVEIAYCVDNIDNPQNLISKLHVDIRYKNISEIKNEDMTDKLILVIKIDVTEKGIKSADYTEVEKIGGVTFFKEMRLFWSGLEYAWRDAKVEHGFGHIKDPLLTYTWIYKATSKKYPGYVVFGNEETAKKRIIILGNSTADAGLYEKFIKSWPEFLSIKLRSSVIFCGAIGGYNSKQELLKLLRDGRQLKPDLVISYSGICDIGQAHMEGFPFVRKPADMKSQEMILGIRKDTTVAEEWVESEIMMKTIANAYSAEFIGIFHPILGNKSKLSCEERLLEVLEEREFSSLIEQKKFQDEVKQYIKNVPYIYDITNVFENRRERIFRDNTHLTEEGNSMIADAVYKIIERI